MEAAPDLTARLERVSHDYGDTRALDEVTVDVPGGRLVGLIGPDGVGKSTLLGLVAGARRIQRGQVQVLGGDMADRAHRRKTCPRIAYMPQGLGKNLYADLSVAENLDFFGRLFATAHTQRQKRIATLLRATGLMGFENRAAGKLSGGMKQKLGLCCALIHDPDLLILDEPTTGVDPLSREQFWILIDQMRSAAPSASVVVSTAYMDEAERFDWLIAMDAGRVLATGAPAELRRRTDAKDLEEAFVCLLPVEKRGRGEPLVVPPRAADGSEIAISARSLTRRFGDFVAVDGVSFEIQRGEIFGFLGSNGCGKTTTMKMLTGLLPASAGEARLFGRPVDARDLETRRRVGYMSQAFSLYGELTVHQNLALHGRLFRLPTEEIARRMDTLLQRFGLRDHATALARDLPLGVQQRLSLAVALIHDPDMLILDEPTSGVDPVARDEFWRLLIVLSRRDGVTIFLSTHFMSEAERCDRVSLMHAGAVLACDTPGSLIASRRASSLEAAFLSYVRDAMGADSAPPEPSERTLEAPTSRVQRPRLAGARRLLAYTTRETIELVRDPVRLAFAFGGSAILMVVFCLGITMDVDGLRYAALDLDRTPESRAYLQSFAGSPYFQEEAPLESARESREQLESGGISLAIEIPPDFGRDLRRGGRPEVSAWIDGAMPFRGETIYGYVGGVHQSYLQNRAMREDGVGIDAAAVIQPRYRYNPTFESIYAIAPEMPPIILMLIPAILTAVSVAREKELGSITNFYVTPTTRVEFVVGKQLPYVAIGFANFVLLSLTTILVFQVPLKGSVGTLTLGALLYVGATTGVGLLISSLTSTQVAAVFATAILTMMPTMEFSGLLQPVSTLDGGARVIGALWPTTYYMHLSVGAFTKGLSFEGLALDLIALAAFLPVLTVGSALALREQDR